jgi:hypothetical protein
MGVKKAEFTADFESVGKDIKKVPYDIKSLA